MKKIFCKVLGLVMVMSSLSISCINPIYANTEKTTIDESETIRVENVFSPDASNYIISYSGGLSSPSSGKLKLTANLSVYDASTKIVADIYRNGSYYDTVSASSTGEDASMSKTLSVSSGNYYVEYSYYALVNGKSVETRSITTNTKTVK